MAKKYDDDDIARLAQLIGESVADNLRAQLETLDDIQNMKQDTRYIKTNMATKEDIQLLQRVILETNNDVSAQETRIRKLEAKTA